MKLLRDGRPLKRWCYVGVYAPELMVCAAEAHVGPLGQRFWAVAEPDGRLLAGRARFGSGGVDVDDGRVRVRATSGGGGVGDFVARARVDIDLALEQTGGPAAVETVSPAGPRGYVWTRKLAGARASGSVVIDGRRRSLEAEAFVDETAGYHSRHTLWRWSAGVGRAVGGERVGWNLVEGINDDPENSERSIWVDGRPSEVSPVSFDEDLHRIRFAGGGELSFRPWAELSHRTRLGLLRSDYRQPFGVFGGELPGGLVLALGFGVTERHEAWW